MGTPPPSIDADSLNKVLSDQACEARKRSWIYNDKGAIALAFHLWKAWISIWFASQVSQFGNQLLECAFQMGILKIRCETNWFLFFKDFWIVGFFWGGLCLFIFNIFFKWTKICQEMY